MGKVLLMKSGGGSGNSELNFSVIGGTTQPVNPKENTIWVDTNTAINGWVFGIVEPEIPIEGMIFFKIGNFSNAEFNALKNNSLFVCPTYALQYINSEWVKMNAVSYQNGAWVEWYVFDGGFLYNYGDECMDATGGWTVSLGSKNETNLYVGSDQNRDSAPAIAKTNKLIDFSTLSSIEAHVVEFYSTTSVGYCEIQLIAEDGTLLKTQRRTYPSASNFTLTIDTFDVSESCYVGIVACNSINDRTTWVKVDKISAVGGDLFYDGYLYKAGSQYTNVTGGWHSWAWRNQSLGTATFDSNGIMVYPNGNSCVAATTVNKIDLTNYSIISFKVVSNEFETDGRTYFGVKADKTIVDEALAAKIDVGLLSNGATYSLDISGLTGEFYVGLFTWNGTSATYFKYTIDEVKLG